MRSRVATGRATVVGMALLDGILYRTRSAELTERSHPGLDVGWYWGGSANPAPASSMLEGWPNNPLTAALAIPTIFRCVSMLSTKVGKFEAIATRQGQPLAIQPSILRRPDPMSTAWDFFSRTAIDILTDRAYWLIQRRSQGRPVAVELLRPSDVSVRWADLRRTRRVYNVAHLGEFPEGEVCLLYTSPSPRDRTRSRMPSSA